MMKKGLPFFIALLCICVQTFAQTTVFQDNFNTSQGSTFTTSGNIGTSPWSVSRSGNDWGARIDNGILELTNDASTTTNAGGWVFASVNTSSFSAPYNTTLSNNPGVVTWTFNMRQIRSNPGGFAAGSYGVALILGCTSTNIASTGDGYAVILGNSGSPDPIRLVHFSGGIQSLGNSPPSANIIIEASSPLDNPQNNYMSLRVTYDPTTNQWQLFGRDDGASGFTDANTGTLSLLGTGTDNTYTSTALPHMGAYWQGSTASNQTAFFDNLTITVTPSLPNYTGAPSGISSGTYNNVTFTSSGSFPANTNITVNGTLQLNDHAINLNGGSITMGATGVVLPGTGSPSPADVGRVFGGNFIHNVATVVADKVFPLGTPTSRRYAAVGYTTPPTTAGTLTAFVTESPAPAQDFTNVSPVSVTVPFYWTINAGGGLSGGTYNFALTADNVPGVLNASALRILKRPTGGGPWTIDGSFATSSFASGTVAIAYTGLSGFSEFSIGSDPSDNPLPVELTSFRGVATAQGVALSWSTASERNNAGFILLRDGVPIASYQFSPALRGRGTTTSTTNYTFLDANVEMGKTYTYQLRSVDFDGTLHDYAPRVTVEVREPVTPPVFEYRLEQNYPNPFNPTTNIKYSIREAGLVSLKVYDLLGREVATLVNQTQPPGEYQVTFNASNLTASGIYIYRLQAGNFTRTMKMMLVK